MDKVLNVFQTVRPKSEEGNPIIKGKGEVFDSNGRKIKMNRNVLHIDIKSKLTPEERASQEMHYERMTRVHKILGRR